ncbi:MAG: type I-C CRISPR-associated protein Cas5c [Bacteriovoracaceae bacterium]|nr:type I-C CRISPR-associated protein Cas5c [Bacteroidota bacterium]
MTEHIHKSFCLEVEGDYACFTRPEMKVERVSYDVPTPSAVRAVFESIFWKPAIRWEVTKIEILNPIKWISVRRNEVGAIMSERSNGILIEDNRQQRASLFLRDVKYRFYAVLKYIPVFERKNNKHVIVPEYLWDSEEKEFMKEETKASEESQETGRKDETPGKYLAIFERRATKGQCFNQPYLGCREFSCHFKFIKNPEKEPAALISETRELGYMLYDMDFTNINDPKPMFFKAIIKNGVVEVPFYESEEIRR